MEELKFQGKYIITADIVAKTGLHIGSSESSLEIGGVDNSVIKDAQGRPYIPGSSLKGKMRALMEYAEGLINPDNLVFTVEKKDNKEESIRIHMCDKVDCPVCNIFGRNHGNHNFVNGGPKKIDSVITPTRLIVRDAYLIEESITKEMKENLDLDWTEVKFENNLDRITSNANPRQTERVPAGARFEGQFILNVLNDEGTKYLKKLLEAMELLEDDYLGGQGSRGYGRIAFENLKIVFRSKEFYEGTKDEEIVTQNCDCIREALNKLK
ncbi:type III-A CRISPR-associated RAMP protein Csm3 [Caldanaerobius polysaccharolyticus]|uniref:type III-A CRISPR-associated RAMP protein Csm3 n=1 Tax=Caldanaerobius polysaccharolyticus TaxID=44256 RepID=UPI00047DFAFB|nr:type III-A CRISPR-associated RAMP protein Csm3 [Caldanaerobius polysaccharolyticus]